MKGLALGLVRVFLPLAVMVGLMVAPVSAQAASDKIYTKVTVEDIAKIMKSEGYAVEVEPGDDDTEADVLWKLDGNKCIIFTYDKGHAIQFYVGFTDVKTSLSDLNEWNKTKRFSRTYLDDEGDPCLELDLDLAGGVTEARMKDFFKTCVVSFNKWHKTIISD